MKRKIEIALICAVAVLQLTAFSWVLSTEYEWIHAATMTPPTEYLVGVIVFLQVAVMLWLIADLWKILADKLYRERDDVSIKDS